MEVLLVLYGLLLLGVIASLPLRMRARRRTLQEIETLTSALEQRMRQLAQQIDYAIGEAQLVSEPAPATDAWLHYFLRVFTYARLKETAFKKPAYFYSRAHLEEESQELYVDVRRWLHCPRTYGKWHFTRFPDLQFRKWPPASVRALSY